MAPEKNPAVARISALPVAPPKRALVHQKSALLAQLSGVEALVEQATAAAPVGSLGARAAGEPSEPPPLVQALAQALTALRPEAREDAVCPSGCTLAKRRIWRCDAWRQRSAIGRMPIDWAFYRRHRFNSSVR